MTITKLKLFIVLAAAGALALGCSGGPAPGEPYEKPAPETGTAQGRLKTDEGAEQGIAGGGGQTATPGAEPVTPGG